MSMTLRVKVEVRRKWTIKASATVGVLLRKCGLPDRWVRSLMVWGIGWMQMRVNGGRWQYVDARRIVNAP